jgi:hypothetical protein
MVARTRLIVTLYVHCLACYHFRSTQRAYRNACIMLLVRWLQIVKEWIYRSKLSPHHHIIVRCINGAVDKAHFNMCLRLFLLCHIGFERKRPLGRPRRRWEDNIKMDLPEEAQHVTVLTTVGNCNKMVPYCTIILWDHRRICGPSLIETSLCGA